MQKSLFLFILISLFSCSSKNYKYNYSNLTESQKKIVIPYTPKLTNKVIDYNLDDNVRKFAFQKITLANLLDIAKNYDVTHLLLIQPYCGGTEDRLKSYNKIEKKDNEIKLIVATTYDLDQIYSYCVFYKINQPIYIIDDIYGLGRQKPESNFVKSILSLNKSIKIKDPGYFKFLKDGSLVSAKWTSMI